MKLPSGIAVNQADAELPPSWRGLFSAHSTLSIYLHNTSVDLMALDDHDEYLRGALALALVVILTYVKRRRARTLAEWALVLDVLEDMEMAEGEK